jgi:uncharacterized protein YjbI with pentapeptide repeats
MEQKELNKILRQHKLWLEGKGGKKADLSCCDLNQKDLTGANLTSADLNHANLFRATLKGANLFRADLTGANLNEANLESALLEETLAQFAVFNKANITNMFAVNADFSGAKMFRVSGEDVILRHCNLNSVESSEASLPKCRFNGSTLINADFSFANLSLANLTDCNLTETNFKCTNLKSANVCGANLFMARLSPGSMTDIVYNFYTIYFNLSCPERGSFIGYKKAGGRIVELLILEDALRSSATTRKCRCNKAKVLSITDIDSSQNYESVHSDHDYNFIYEVGKIVEVPDFDKDRWAECSTGIHFFITRQEAIDY